MRILVNENMPGSVVAELRSRGHDVLAAKESMQGEDDAVILDRAQTEARLVVIQDKDFGELAFRSGLPAQSGIILFRLTGDDPQVELAHMMPRCCICSASIMSDLPTATRAAIFG